MKHIFILAILTFTMNVFAQINLSKIENPKIQCKNKNGKESIVHLKSVAQVFNINQEKEARYQILVQDPEMQMVDSIYYWDWDVTANCWMIYGKSINYTYNNKNYEISSIYEVWNGVEWINSEKDSIDFDSKNNPISYLWQKWDGNNWENIQKGTMTYDPNNNMKSEMVQDWDSFTWENILLISYEYDENSNETSYIHQNWNGSEWENAWQHIYSYDANKNLTGDQRQIWNEGVWENSDKYIWIYDENNKLIKDSTQYFNGGEWTYSGSFYEYDAENNLTIKNAHSWGQSWNDYSITTYSFDLNGNLLNVLEQNVDGENLENLYQSTYSYDSNNNQTSWLSKYWRNGSWIIAGLNLYGYNDNNFNISYSLKEWDSSGTEITTGDSTYIYYHTTVSSNSGTSNLTEPIKIYPNPAIDYIEISTSDEILSICLYNISGQLQIRLVGNKSQHQKTAVNMLTAGIYIVEIATRSGVFKQKVVIEW